MWVSCLLAGALFPPRSLCADSGGGAGCLVGASCLDEYLGDWGCAAGVDGRGA